MTPAGEHILERRARLRRRLRITALVVFISGILAACLVYGLSAPPIASDDPATIANDKIDTRQFSQMYGNGGLLEKEWLDQMKYPGTKAAMVFVSATVAAGALLLAARALNPRA